MKWLIVLILLITNSAVAQNYLVFNGVDTSTARLQAEAVSKTKCQQMGCDGVKTIFWWEVICHPTLPQCAVKTETFPKSTGDFTSNSMTALQKSTLVPLISMDPTWFTATVQAGQ